MVSTALTDAGNGRNTSEKQVVQLIWSILKSQNNCLIQKSIRTSMQSGKENWKEYVRIRGKKAIEGQVTRTRALLAKSQQDKQLHEGEIVI